MNEPTATHWFRKHDAELVVMDPATQSPIGDDWHPVTPGHEQYFARRERDGDGEMTTTEPE